MTIQKEFSMNIGETKLSLEFGKLAPKADVSVYCQMGDTVVLVTVVSGGLSNLGYFPLSVEYVEKLYAGGIIKGSRWVKREGKPTDEAILKGRIIDRSIRPLFPKAYKKDVQVVATLLSYDGKHSPDMLAGIGVSAGLHVSGIPWNGPISLMRVGYVDQNDTKTFVINPDEDVQDYSELDLVVSSTRKKVVMIETLAQELPESVIAEGIEKAHAVNVKIAEFIDSIRQEIGIEKEEVPVDEATKALKDELHKTYLDAITVLKDKKGLEDEDFKSAMSTQVDEIFEALNEEYDKKAIFQAIEDIMLEILRDDIIDNGKRVDGRALDQVRELRIENDILPRTHGSAIFQRGATQVLSVATLGSTSLSQLIESVQGEENKRYIHHYFSPPYTYGETGRMGWPGRREIGHGALAEKALMPVLPSEADFPYTIRVVSEVMSSNGSTSMASTCGSTLALMDAGVPIKAPVAGISVGLMYRSDDDYVLLTDIAGIEDFAGHMDFKIAGTRDGITAIQLDVKNDGLTGKMIGEIFTQSKTARNFILDKMAAVLAEPRKSVSEFAPKVVQLTPPEDKIGEIIGPGGKNIKKIIALTGTDINISDQGIVSISGVDSAAVERAVESVKSVYRTVQVGEEFEGPVSRILPIGAMVEYLPGREGLVHVSKLSDEYVKNVRDIVNEGDVVTVKVEGVDDRGRINLKLVSKK